MFSQSNPKFSCSQSYG